jgi:hypothetical protein
MRIGSPTPCLRRRYGQRRTDYGPLAGSALHAERSAKDLYTLAHACEPQVTFRDRDPRIKPFPAIGDFDQQLAVMRAQGDPLICSSAMAEAVGQ